MADNEYTWSGYANGIIERGKRIPTVFTIDHRFTTPRVAFVAALSTYFHNDMKTTNYITAKGLPKKDSASSSNDYLRDIPLRQAISPLKLLNPFKLVEAISSFTQFALGGLIARNLEADSVMSKVAKACLVPFAALNTLITPLTSLEYMPPLQKVANFFGIKSLLAKEKEQEIEMKSFSRSASTDNTNVTKATETTSLFKKEPAIKFNTNYKFKKESVDKVYVAKEEIKETKQETVNESKKFTNLYQKDKAQFLDSKAPLLAKDDVSESTLRMR